MFSSIATLFTTVILAASSLVAAAPLSPTELIVWSPKVTSPQFAAIWSAGSTQNVTWDTSNMPAEKANSTGLILMGYNFNNSENLDIHHPLATGFPLNTGSVVVTVPSNVTIRMNNIIVLFGDSGNASPQFITTPSL